MLVIKMLALAGMNPSSLVLALVTFVHCVTKTEQEPGNKAIPVWNEAI